MNNDTTSGEPAQAGSSPPAKTLNAPRASTNAKSKPSLVRSSADVWKPRRLDAKMFPHTASKGTPATIPNVAYMLERHGITARYNVIKKKLELSIPGMSHTVDNADNVSLTHILSLASLNSMRTEHLPAYVEAIGDANAYNPVADWIESAPWDGCDRLEDFYATLQTREGYPEDLKRTLMRKWLLSAVAAALSTSGFKCRGVLTLQGPQGIGKTTWGKRLISDPTLRDTVIKTDHHLDGGNKDSLLAAITHFIVEIGELESSFKRDVSRLKGFLTADSDKVRRPYARIESPYPRRTVFYATVNSSDFLVDHTGNSRWWTLPVVSVDFDHDIPMQQLFAQLAVDFRNGEPWWLNADEERQLESQNEAHRSGSVVRDRVLALIDLDGTNTETTSALTATELLMLAGFDRPSNPQMRECGGLLREVIGEPRRINGRDKWRVPLLSEEDASPGLRVDSRPDRPDPFD